ncbi:shikimate kinase [Geomesophilobacter sediminis]|uniref:Shikimate kinase n=1 Tax=Geomesophilobacter sediminis TaxID=2798584 RepID=A0A8J7M1X0_9BACT|nr:shikimate kinase [Geomesophilobacter sediminis]MBJ6727112.1 shikimate kinase [Geomesophilobacter sediminis]
MNLVLIGYRGTGKSHIGRLVARQLKMRCFSMDREIEKQAGRTIPEIVADDGWTVFRDLESDMVRRLTALDHVMLDTGGGVIERPENVAALRKNSCVIWMTAGLDTIVTRISSGIHRPSLTGDKSFTDEVAEVLERRNPLYRDASHYQVSTDGREPEAIAAEIVDLWEQYRAAAGPRGK